MAKKFFDRGGEICYISSISRIFCCFDFNRPWQKNFFIKIFFLKKYFFVKDTFTKKNFFINFSFVSITTDTFYFTSFYSYHSGGFSPSTLRGIKKNTSRMIEKN